MFKKLAISTFTFLSFCPLNLQAAPVETMANNSLNNDRLREIIGDRLIKESKLNVEENSGDRSIENINNSIFQDSLKIETMGARIIARFVPQNNLGQSIDLQTLAKSLGYDSFNWVSYVEQDPHGITNQKGQLLTTPYNDPPIGGYQYDAADQLPFYWDVEECHGCSPRHNYQHSLVTQQYQLVFEDIPSDPRLQPGEAIKFVTHLVGVKNYDLQNKTAEWDVLNTFRWQLTNLIPGRGWVSLTETNLELAKLPTLLLAEMQADGALLPDAVWIAHRPAFPSLDTSVTRATNEFTNETIR